MKKEVLQKYEGNSYLITSMLIAMLSSLFIYRITGDANVLFYCQPSGPLSSASITVES